MTARSGLNIALSYALLGLFAILTATMVTIRTDLSFVFPREGATPEIELLVERIQHGSDAGLILIGLSGVEPDELIDLSFRLATHLEDSDRFRFVANGRIRPPGPEFAPIFDMRYLLNPPIKAEDFSVASLRHSLEQALDLLATGSGAAIKQYLPRDPTGRLSAIASYWSGAKVSSPRPGIWLTNDRSTALIMAQSSAEAFDLAEQEATLNFIYETFAELAAADEVRLDLTGPSVFAAKTSKIIRDEMQVLTAAALILVAALFYGAFRSIRFLVAFLLPVGFAICSGIITVQILFGHVHGVTIAFGGTLIGIAVDYQIHLINHATAKEGSRFAIEKIWHTLRLGALTTIVAFFPMAMSRFPGISQLGVFAGFGLAAAVLTTRWLVPGILPKEPVPPPSALWDKLPPADWLARSARLLAFASALGCLGYLVYQGPGIWQTDLRNLSPLSNEARQLDRRLRHEIGAGDVRYLLFVRGGSDQEVLEKSEALAADLYELVADGGLTGFDMAASYIPSIKAQDARRLLLPERQSLQTRLAAASEGLPFRPQIFEPFFQDIERSRTGPPLTIDDLRDSGLAWAVEPLIFNWDGDWFGLILPKGVEDPMKLAEFAARQRDFPVSFFDLKSSAEDLVADYRRQAVNWLSLGAILAVLMLGLGLRSVTRVARVMLPVILAILITLGFLSLIGIQFSIFHLLSLLLVAGIGLDYALFFDRISRYRDNQRLILRGNVLCAATSITVFSVLAFSRIPVLHGIGITVALGASLALLVALIFADFRNRTEQESTC